LPKIYESALTPEGDQYKPRGTAGLALPQSSGGRQRFSGSVRSQNAPGSSDIAFNLNTGVSRPRVDSSGLGSRSTVHRPSQVHLESSPVTQEKVQSAISDSSSFEQQKLAQPFQQVEQVQLKQTPSFLDSPVIQSPITDSSNRQLKIKIDDVLEQSSVPIQLAQLADDKTHQQRLSIESFSNKYLQQKVPVQIPGYVPLPSFMAPFNYRVPQIKSSGSTVPIVQEQQRLEQILA